MNDSLNGSLPHGWRLDRLDSFAEVVSGHSPKGETYNCTGEGMPLINGPAEYGPKFPRATKWTSRPTRCCKSGDILFCVRGNTTGRMNVADREYCIGRGVAAIRGRDGIAATPFVQQVLTWIAPRILAEASAGGSTFPNITDSRLKEWPIIAPPLVEQWGIAAVLGRIQAAVAVQQTIFDRVAELKAAMMAKFFSVGIHGGDSQDTEAGPVPANWTVNRLIEIARVERGKFTHRPRNDPAFYGGDIPFIQTGDVTAANGRVNTYSQTLNQRGLSVSKMFPRGTILTTIAANIGDFAILDFTCAFPDSIVGITPHSSNLTEFLCYFLQTRKAYLNHIAPRGTQKNVSLKILEPLPVALPSDDAERQEIVEILQAIDARHETAIRQCQLYQELFNVVRDQLMTGRIRVGDLSLTELAGANS